MVSAIGVYLSTRLVSDSLDERFTRQLFEAASVAADSIAQREDLHLSTYRSIAFSEGIDEAILNNNRESLEAIAFPHVVNNRIGQLHIINNDGLQLLVIGRSPGSNAVEDYGRTGGTKYIDLPIVQKVLSGVVDDQGDKFVSLAELDGRELFLTAGPVKQGDRIIGAVLVGSYVQDLALVLKQATFAEVTLYNYNGQLVDTTFTNPKENADMLALDPRTRSLLLAEGGTNLERDVDINRREYDLLFSPLSARGMPVGFYAVGVQTTFINLYGNTARNQIVGVFTVTLLLVFGIGYFTANAITGRVQHLMENAVAVAGGDFSRRTEISSADEIGQLAYSLDNMTESLANYTSALQDRIDELIALYDSSTAVTVQAGLDLDHILHTIAASIKGVIHGTEEVVVYLQEKDEYLVPKAPKKKVSNFPTFSLAHISPLLELAKPRVASLADIEPHIVEGAFTKLFVSDVIIAPFIAGNETIGMLLLVPHYNAFIETLLDDDSERLLGTLINQAAVAIKNAQLFQATQLAYEELRQLDDLKTKFINIAAHELRTPLGAMLGYASFVQKRVPPVLTNATRFLVASTLRMRTMVDAMLAIQRLDAGRSFLRLNTVDVRDIIKKSVVDFQPIADLEKHTLTANLPAKLPPIQADAEKIGLVLSNLLSNAIKFTPEGGTIVVSAQDYLKGVLVSVRDSGVGIAPDDQDRVFDRFYQARPDHLAGHGGIGIGLYIVKHLVELHQGQIWVESEVDKGSTFFFTLPEIELEGTNGSTSLEHRNEKTPLLEMT